MHLSGVQAVGVTASADAPGEAALLFYVVRGATHAPLTGVADFGLSATKARNSNIVGIQIHGTETTYLFGPRLTLPHAKRFTPFAEALVGFARANHALYDASSSQTSWAWAAGGGLEVRLNGNFSFRPIELDHLQTHLSEIRNGPQFQNDEAGAVIDEDLSLRLL